ncbi:MAG: hypothetical protein ACYCWE_04950 [Eubacteriales bacterium]
MYCNKCKMMFDNNFCPTCKLKAINEPKADDFVFLVEKDAITSDIIEGVFKDNNIIYIKKGNRGAAFSIIAGPLFENFKFYVPYDKYNYANELINAYFT